MNMFLDVITFDSSPPSDFLMKCNFFFSLFDIYVYVPRSKLPSSVSSWQPNWKMRWWNT